MLNTILDFVLHNLLFRELFVVFLIVLAMLRYIHRYVKASNNPNVRIRRRRMATTLAGTRHLLIVLVLVLVAVVAYDRVWPHFSGQTVTTHKVAKKSSIKIHTATSKSSSKKKAKAESIKGAVASASSVTVPDGAMSKEKAADIVANYFGHNPSEADKASDAYKTTKVGNGDASIAVYTVTGYAKNSNGKLKAAHEYWVYANGKFTTKF